MNLAHEIDWLLHVILQYFRYTVALVPVLDMNVLSIFVMY